MHLVQPLIDCLVQLGWDRAKLSLEFTGYSDIRFANTLDDSLTVRAPKGEGRNTRDGTRIVLVCDIDEAKIERKVINTEASGWEKQVFLWHAKATFACMSARADIANRRAAAEAEEKATQQRVRDYVGVDAEQMRRVNRMFSVRHGNLGEINIDVQLDYDNQPHRCWPNVAERQDKIRRLAAFMLAEGWGTKP